MVTQVGIIRHTRIKRSRDMKKQAIAMVASGLLLASGMTFAQEAPEAETAAPAAAAGTNTGAGAGAGAAEGTLGRYGGVALGVAAVGLAVAAASDSGDGSSGTTGTTGTVGTN